MALKNPDIAMNFLFACRFDIYPLWKMQTEFRDSSGWWAVGRGHNLIHIIHYIQKEYSAQIETSVIKVSMTSYHRIIIGPGKETRHYKQTAFSQWWRNVGLSACDNAASSTHLRIEQPRMRVDWAKTFLKIVVLVDSWEDCPYVQIGLFY